MSVNFSNIKFFSQAILRDVRTGKLLHVGTRNSYCCICARAAQKNQEPPTHTCYKNFSGSATAMEQDIIVDYFRTSEELHGVRFLKFVGDGDSSVMARIRERCPYGWRVQKVPCKNHLIRCYTSGLYSIALNSALKFPEARKLLRGKIDPLVKAANCAISAATQDEVTPHRQKVKELIQNLRNGPKHVFGEHQGCGAWCNKKTSSPSLEGNFVEYLKKANIWKEIEKKVDYMVLNAEHLRSNKNTNMDEMFMAINNKFQGSKRICRSKKRGYQGRTHAAALRYHFGADWSAILWKNVVGRSPSSALKKISFRRRRKEQKSTAARKLRLEKNPELRARKKGGHVSTADCTEYGRNAAKDDVPEDIFLERQRSMIEKLRDEISTKEKREDLFNKTIGQFHNPFYVEAKRHRLTASNFGGVIKMTKISSAPGLVSKILYPKNLSANKAIQYGIINEENARRRYELQFGVEVRESGLCTNECYPLLAASPDGFVGCNGILEIKCLESVKNSKLFAHVAARQGLDEEGNPIIIDGKRKKKDKFSSLCLEIDEKTKKLCLKKKHCYSQQVDK